MFEGLLFDAASLGAVALGFAAGLLIGCVGVGGVILAPLLVYAAGYEPAAAIAGATFAYIVSGVVGAAAYARKGSIDWRSALWLWVGAAPAALLGALTVSVAPGEALEAAIGLLALGGGLHALFSRAPEAQAAALRPATLVGVGSCAGYLSALTGTGGPLALAPMLMALGAPVLTTLGLAQAIQLPIATMATAGNVFTGILDLGLGLSLAVGISLGVWIGARMAHALPRETLRRGVSALMLLVGVLLLAKPLLV